MYLIEKSLLIKPFISNTADAIIDNADDIRAFLPDRVIWGLLKYEPSRMKIIEIKHVTNEKWSNDIPNTDIIH